MTSRGNTKKDPVRCDWTGDDPLYQRYHDEEWGVPNGDDGALFEKLILEGFQAGLSWITVLRKREHFRTVFDNFDAEKMVRYSAKKLDTLKMDPGIIRNKLKIEASVTNARAYLDLRDEQSFASFLWGFVDGRTIQNSPRSLADIAAETAESRAISKALKARGFKFCGPTICYALMQSVGMVNDHLVGCHRHKPCAKLAKNFKAPEA